MTSSSPRWAITRMPHAETGAIYDFSTHVVLPGNQLLMARLGHGGGIDGRYHFGLGENTLVKVVASMQPNPAKDTFQVRACDSSPFCSTRPVWVD